MINKLVIASTAFLISSTIMAADIIGVGQIGDKYVYKIKGVLVSLSAGDVVAGCTVKNGSGLQCTNSNNTKNYDDQSDLGKLRTINELFAENQKIVSYEKTNVELQKELDKTNKEMDSLKKSYIAKINKRNKTINNLSFELNKLK